MMKVSYTKKRTGSPPSRGRQVSYCSRSSQRNLAGFTVIELTVVLAVIAALMGGMIALVTASLENKSYSVTAAKLKVLQQTLADYRIAYNRLPCPANSATATTSGDFGLEAATTGYCMGGSPAADAGHATAAAAVGMIPVRTLGLPDEMAIDGWGRRIRYAVATAFVASDAFDGVAPTATTAYMTVNNNDSGLAMTDKAVYALASYGADGHGAYGGRLNGGAATAFNAGMTNANTLINCKCTSAGAYDTAYDSAAALGTFVQGDVKPDYSSAVNNFDDLVVFATRVDLRDANE